MAKMSYTGETEAGAKGRLGREPQRWPQRHTHHTGLMDVRLPLRGLGCRVWWSGGLVVWWSGLQFSKSTEPRRHHGRFARPATSHERQGAKGFRKRCDTRRGLEHLAGNRQGFCSASLPNRRFRARFRGLGPPDCALSAKKSRFLAVNLFSDDLAARARISYRGGMEARRRAMKRGRGQD